MMKFLSCFLKKVGSSLFLVLGLLLFSSSKSQMLSASNLPEKSEATKSESYLSVRGPRLTVNRGMNFLNKRDTVSIKDSRSSDAVSVQQLIKGNVSGVYVQEVSGEPGFIQNMVIRGLSSPVFSNRDVSSNQPVVFVNGMPIITNHPFLYDFKTYDINPIGTGSNVFAGIDIQSIESIEVVKDPVELAKLGPLAANGAVIINTKDGYYGGKTFSVSASTGVALAPFKVQMTNGAYEKEFRQQFYDAYDVPFKDQYFPDYLSDHRELNYFGEPDWAKEYYQSAPLYNAHVSIGNGNEIANYLFSVGITGNDGVASDVGLTKYNVAFSLNMMPIKGFSANSYINAANFGRKRNMFFKDRIAEMEYMPDLSLPIAPSNGVYGQFMDNYDSSKENNKTNLLNGYLALQYAGSRFYAKTNLHIDYTSDIRHVFWPSSLMESMSFVSDFSGYNRRLVGNASLGYLFDIGSKHFLDLHLKSSLQADYHHYNYITGFDGEDDTKTTTNSGGFSKIYRLADKVETRLVSTSIGLNYSYRQLLFADLLARYDGSSNMQSDSRWLFTPSASLGWDIHKHFVNSSSKLSDLFLKVSWGRLGRLVQSDRFKSGPNYVSSEMSWVGQSLLSSANGYAALTRPYSQGWVGYDMGWPYTDMRSIDLNLGFFDNRINTKLSFYNNKDQNLTLPLSTNREMGYLYRYANGMEISNRGVDLNVSVSVINNSESGKLNWDLDLNMNYNQNTLEKLPEGLDEVIVNDRKLVVGKPIDAFWLLQNNGIYANDVSIPSIDGEPMTVEGMPIKSGDPIWVDVNHDNIIDNNDRVLTGNVMPKFIGGLTNRFSLHRFDLSFNMFFALGHNALNVRDYQRYDFRTLDYQNNLSSLKEITFWQKGKNQKDDYPIYNPMSEVHPYRLMQDLFLESLSYLKLRNVTIGYTLPLKSTSYRSLESIYFYLSMNNLFTITNFSGYDPELVGFNGYYDSYSITIPRTALLGLRFEF